MVRRTDFYDWQGPHSRFTAGDLQGTLPIYYHDNDVFSSVHTASYEAVLATLPTNVLQPARWVDGRALVAIFAFRYHTITWTAGDGTIGRLAPYGEVSVSALVTTGSAPRALPLLRRRVGGYVLQLPVTTAEARDGGLIVHGFPKFVADMDFEEQPDLRRVQVSEGGSSILTLTVRPRGPVLVERRPLVAYTTQTDKLLKTVIPVLAHMQIRPGGRAGELLLGEHEVADGLRRLEISPAPLAIISCLDHRSILPAGRPIGPARAYHGYAGADRKFGRYTVSYPHTGPFDQYATAPMPEALGLGTIVMPT